MNTIKFYYTISVFCELENLDPKKVTYHDLVINNSFYETKCNIDFIETLIEMPHRDFLVKMKVLKDFATTHKRTENFIESLPLNDYIDTLEMLQESKNFNESSKTYESKSMVMRMIIEKEVEKYRQSVLQDYKDFLKEVK